MSEEHTKWRRGPGLPLGYSCLSYKASQQLPFQIYFKKIFFPKVCADWCEENVVGAWGWYFEEDFQLIGTFSSNVYIGFEHQNDMFMFQIYWAEQFDRREQCS